MSKSSKSPKQAHTSNAKYGMGDYHGSGIKNKTARISEDFDTIKIPKNKLKNAPKSLA